MSATASTHSVGHTTVHSEWLRSWWVPSAFVAVTLLLLLGEPVLVHRRTDQLRQEVDIVDQARVLVNDLEAAFATELFARDPASGLPPVRADSIYRAALAQEQVDGAALDSLVALVDGPAARWNAQLHTAERLWHARLATAGMSGASPGASAPPRKTPPGLLSAAEALDSYLAERSSAIRGRIWRYGRLDVIVAVILVPIGLAAVGVAVWSGHRVLSLARSLEHERAALAQSVQLRTALVHGVSHDVKNPLGAALGYITLMEEGVGGKPGDQHLHMLERMRRLMESALRTIGELLEVAGPESGQLKVVRAPTDLGEIVADSGEDFRAAAQAKRIALEVTPPSTPLVVDTDAARVRRVVENLLSNAVKYTPPGGRVRVHVENGGHADVRIAVEDSGSGVPPELRERVFEEFYRAPEAAKAAPGNGVGLAASRRAARALGGEVEVSESPLGGAAFTLRLPVHADRPGV